jgi:hypothetical protein
MQRRKFIKNAALGSALVSGTAFSAAARNSFRVRQDINMFIGTPVLPEILYERGIPECLDAMKELAGVNTVMTFTHDHVFNQYRKDFQPKTDAHGNEYTNVWVKTHPEYYRDPALQGRNDEGKYAGRDILDELYEEAQPRDMKVYGRILEPYVITGAIPGFEAFAEVDANGNKGRNVCYNHPEYMAYWDSVVEDLVRTHPYLAGFKFGQERGGPILSSMGKANPGTCFCEHCLPLAKKRGIDPEVARKGLIAIQEFGNSINAGEKPVDGNFVTFFRILATYPDVLAHEQFWMDSREAQRKRMYKKIKSINEKVQVGWHIDHGMTWDLITRATWDYSKMGPYSDWLSVAVYFDSMGRRSLGHYNKNYKDILFGDASEEHSYPMYLSMLGYDPEMEPPLDQHRNQDTSFSSDYVYRECRRAVEAVNGAASVHARPGFDMPGYNCNVTPEEVYNATTKALEAGVDGLWCGREWDELRPENAQAFGNAVRDWHAK